MRKKCYWGLFSWLLYFSLFSSFCHCFFFHSFIHSFIHSYIHLLSSLSYDRSKVLHTVRSRSFSFKWDYPLLSLSSSSSFLRLLPRLPVTSIPPFIFPSITCYSRQFLRKIIVFLNIPPFQIIFNLLTLRPSQAFQYTQTYVSYMPKT